MRKKNPWAYRQSKPANYVLWSDGLSFYVSKRVGPKKDSSHREHFVAFMTHEADAWLEAEARTLRLIDTLQEHIQYFQKERRRAKRVKK